MLAALNSNCRFWFHWYRPEPGSLIVDVGAGRGEDLEEMIATGAYIMAIEAHPFQFAALRAAALAWPNVTCINAAVIDRVGRVGITDSEQWEDNEVIAGDEIEALTLDGILAGVPVVDLLKINIEGGEVRALAGAREVLRKTRYAVVSAHDFRAERGEGERFRTRSVVTNALADAGFKTDVTPGWDHVHGWRA